MAVQAQYPSNILFLNRNGQERKDMIGGDTFSLQPQTNDFLDQSASPFLFPNTVPNNTRKRGRETGLMSETGVNLFTVHSQPPAPTLVDLSQLQNPQQRLVSTGLKLSLEDQQQQRQHAGSSNSSSSFFSAFLTEDLANEIRRQRDEIAQLLQSQGEQLRRALAERRQRQYRSLLSAFEDSANRALRDKEAEFERAVRFNMQLEERIAQLKAEAQVWQTKAKAQDLAVATLQTQLQQAMLNGVGTEKKDEPGRVADVEDAESAFSDPDRVVAIGPFCKACRRHSVSVVVLPCRHLCLCTKCDAVVAVCPTCQTTKSASVQVFFS